MDGCHIDDDVIALAVSGLRSVRLMIPTLTTARLVLRPFREDDAGQLHHILSEDGVLRYFPNPQPPSRQRIKKFIQAQLHHYQEHGFGWWAVEPLSGKGLIGWNGLQFLPETDETEIGFLLSKAFWGQGLAFEGAQVGLRLGFETLSLQEIVAIVHPENKASQRVIEKLGMSFTNETEYFGMQVFRYAISAMSHKTSS